MLKLRGYHGKIVLYSLSSRAEQHTFTHPHAHAREGLRSLRTRPDRSKTPPLKQRAMLAALAHLGNVSHACLCVGICRKTHYRWLAAYPDYREAVADAMEEAYDNLKAEAYRRAVTGTLTPVYQNGRKVGQVRVYSDRLLIWLLMDARPEKYGK